jgi:hypothetical protein
MKKAWSNVLKYDVIANLNNKFKKANFHEETNTYYGSINFMLARHN